MLSQASCKVLAVDDDPDLLATLVDCLLLHKFEVVTASNGKEALQVAEAERPDVAILDVTMPELDGLQATKLFKAHPELRYLPIILLTARDEVEQIVEGLECGADDYLSKPFKERELLARVQAALRTKAIYSELAHARRQNAQLQEVLVERYAFGNIIGGSAPMQELYRLIQKVAVADIPVLISGESGTGKELVAKALHFNSSRFARSFVVQNCAAFQDNLLEAELFGYSKGAFTGATRDKKGLFEVAHQGTLFLDEVGEMSASLQAKLLRVLQDGSFIPVGDTQSRTVDVRLICASHRDLKKMVEEGRFREDLLYRINVVQLNLPALRDRSADIPLLVQHFLKLYSESATVPRVSSELMNVLVNYSWPGNVRQLQNEIRRLLVLADKDQEELGVGGLSSEIGSENRIAQNCGPVSLQASTLKEALDNLERQLIEQTLLATAGNRSETARRLGVSRSNLINKIQQYGL